MIRGIDITKLLTTGDQTGLRSDTSTPRHAIGKDNYTVDQINDALVADSNADISTSKSKRSVDFLAKAMDSVYSRNKRADGALPSSRIQQDDAFTEGLDRLSRFMTSNIMGSASQSISCLATVIPVSSGEISAYALVGNGAATLACESTVVPVAGFELTSTCTADATIQKETFQVIDYRWGPNDPAEEWRCYSDPDAFRVDESSADIAEWGDVVWLAVRVRLSGSVELTGDDWDLYYRVEGGNGNVDIDWTKVSTTSNIFRLFTPNPSIHRTGTTPLDKANAVTRPGPGNPETYDYIVIAQDDAQSPTISAGLVTSNTEVEVWYPINLKDPGGYLLNRNTEVYFKMESVSLTTTGLNVVPGNSATGSYWWRAAIE